MSSRPWMRILASETPEAWLQAAAGQLELLVLDHAHCERKAASTALSLMYRYPELDDLQHYMSRLAREELRHYEQVLTLLRARGWQFRKLKPSRYAAGLHALVRAGEPGRLLDSLIAGAVIEARSCERFAALAPRLDDELSDYYQRLCVAEARHFEQYLELAAKYDRAGELDSRLQALRAGEAELIATPDERFRFHSGLPIAA